MLAVSLLCGPLSCSYHRHKPREGRTRRGEDWAGGACQGEVFVWRSNRYCAEAKMKWVQYYLCVCLVKNYMKEGEEKEEEEVD